MILVTGGSSQGKREFVRQYLGGQDREPVVWTEGAEASWEEFMEGRFCPGAVNLMDQSRNSFLRSCLPDQRTVFWLPTRQAAALCPQMPLNACTGRRTDGCAAGLQGRRRKCGGCAAG